MEITTSLPFISKMDTISYFWCLPLITLRVPWQCNTHNDLDLIYLRHSCVPAPTCSTSGYYGRTSWCTEFWDTFQKSSRKYRFFFVLMHGVGFRQYSFDFCALLAFLHCINIIFFKTGSQRQALKVLNFWKFTSYCSLKPLWSGMGEVVLARTSPTLHSPSPPTVYQLSWLALWELSVKKQFISNSISMSYVPYITKIKDMKQW